MPDMPAHAAAVLLMFVVLPAWVLAGLAEYLCHRASQIEQTGGVPESILHLIQFSSIGMPTTLALFVQINSMFFLLAALAIVLHHLVAFIDVRYANSRRAVTPFEQMVHSVLEIAPITAFLLLAVLHWSDLQGLLGHPVPPEGWSIRLKNQPLPVWYVAGAIASAGLLNGLPYLEELVRCVRKAR